jgi:DNA-binding LacI/PurR family transcriptional regulator
MPITAKDIARELNISQSTVSRILSGDRQHRVSEQTRRLVWETAKRVGYQPNAVARSLRRGKTDIIGVYTNHNYDVRNEFVGTIVGALQRRCEGMNLDLLLHSGYSGGPADVLFGKLSDGRIDGLILHATEEDALVKMLARSSLPIVTVADKLPGLPGVTCDDIEGMRQLIALLWDKGYRRYAYLAPPLRLTSVDRRRTTFRDELTARGLPGRDRLEISVPYEEAQLVLDELLRLGPGLVVCCWNDRTAYNILHECYRRGLRIPQDLGVAGFDGFRAPKIPLCELVTVQCPWEQVAAVAFERLLQLVAQPDYSNDDAHRDVCLPVTVLDGNSA